MTRTSAPLVADTIAAASEWVEAREYIFGFDYFNADALEPNESSSLLATLFAANRQRTFAFWSEHEEYHALSLIARFASSNYAGTDSTIIGSNWALPGVTPDDNMTEAQANEIVRKRANYYAPIAGFNLTRRGTSFAEFIDKVVWEDWLAYSCERAVIRLLATEPRVPLTSRGTRSIKAVLRGVCEQGRLNGGFAPGTLDDDYARAFRDRTANQSFTGAVPDGYALGSAPQSTADSSTRTAPEISIVGIYSGGVNNVDIRIRI